MAKTSLFGRLKDSVKKTVQQLFGVKFDSGVTHEPPESTEKPKFDIFSPVLHDDSEFQGYADSDSASSSSTDWFNEAYKENLRLQALRDEYTGLISEANQRWEIIESQGLSSMAINRAQDEAGRDYFTLDDLQSEGDILAEVTRARVFIADQTSTLEGAKLYTAQINSEEFRGKFGSKYRTPEYDNKGFDTSVIDEEYAKQVFRSYRMLEEEKQDLIKSYGSENLIIAMYDARVRGNDPFLAGLDLIETWYRTKTASWNDRFQAAVDQYNDYNSHPHGTVSDYVSGGVDESDEWRDRSDELYF